MMYLTIGGVFIYIAAIIFRSQIVCYENNIRYGLKVWHILGLIFVAITPLFGALLAFFLHMINIIEIVSSGIVQENRYIEKTRIFFEKIDKKVIKFFNKKIIK